jgi:hypothetical protein
MEVKHKKCRVEALFVAAMATFIGSSGMDIIKRY